MTAPVRTLAVAAAVASLALAAPASASASVAGTLCSLAGWLSGAAGKACEVASHPGRVIDAGRKLAGGHVGGAIDALTGSGPAGAVTRVAGAAAVAAAIIGGAHEALKLTAGAIGTTTEPDLRSTWFAASYWRMAAVAALLTVPFLCAAGIQALVHGDLGLLVRAAFGYLPAGLLAVGIAAPLTALLLTASDEMSAIVSATSAHAGAGFLDRIGAVGGGVALGTGSLFVSFFIALFAIAAAITLWLELLIRQAAVYVIVLMLPLFFAAMVWPARRIWAMRAVELLAALILSKFAIVAVLGLGGAALGHTIVPGVGSLLAGTTLVLLAAFSPWALLRLLPLHELAGAAAGGLRPQAGQQPRIADDRAYAATDLLEHGAHAEAAHQLRARLSAVMPGRGPASATEWEQSAADGVAAVPAERQPAADEAADAGPSGADVLAGGSPGSRSPAAAASAAGARAVGAPVAGAAAAGAAATGAAEPQPGARTSSDVGAPPPAPPEQDAFGPTTRDGPLPAAIEALGGAEVLDLHQPRVDGLVGPLPPLPPPPDPEDGVL